MKAICVLAFLLSVQALSAYPDTDMSKQQQFLELKITNKGTEPIKVRGNLRWGFWYLEGDRQKQIQPPTEVIQPGQSRVFAAASRLNTPTSVEGRLNIYRLTGANNEKEIAKVEFDGSHSGDNRFRVRLMDDERYSTNQPDYHEQGVLGRLHLKLFQH